jgi:hypothetical protein
MGKGWVWDWLVVRLSVVVMHSMCGYNGRLVWWGGYRYLGYGIRVGLLRMLGLLRYLVWSMSYALLKNLICSNLNYLGAIDTMTSKAF